MADESKRYVVVFSLKADTSLSELATRVPALQEKVSRLANGEMEQLFRSTEGLTFAMLFKSKAPQHAIWSELDFGTGNGDSFLVLEAGDLVTNKGFGRAATWLQRH